MKHNFLVPGAVILSGVIVAGAMFPGGSHGSTPENLTAGMANSDDIAGRAAQTSH